MPQNTFEVSEERLYRLAHENKHCRAGAPLVFGVPLKVGATPRAICAARLVDDRKIRCDLAAVACEAACILVRFLGTY